MKEKLGFKDQAWHVQANEFEVGSELQNLNPNARALGFGGGRTFETGRSCQDMGLQYREKIERAIEQLIDRI